MVNDSERTPLAQNLVNIRRRLGLTQENVATAIGIERSRYAHYEKSTTPPAEVLRKLAVVLKVSLDELLYSPQQFSRFSEHGSFINPYTPIVFGELKGEEKEFILKLRLLSEEDKQAVAKLMNDRIDKLDL